MSIKTWKDEFYSVGAADVSKEAATAHSLKKWRGLTPANLQKHGLTHNNQSLADAKDAFFVVDTTCALCHHYVGGQGIDANADDDDLDDGTNGPCVGCPLFHALGDQRCDEPVGPYTRFRKTGDAEPMIKALEAAAKWEKQCKAE